MNSKWIPDSPYWSQISYREARLDEETRRKIIDYANILFERLGCRDYARFDFRADAEGEIRLLEVNPNPGWCWDGKLNLMAEMAGLRYSDLLEADHRDRTGAGRGATPGPRHPVRRAAHSHSRRSAADAPLIGRSDGDRKSSSCLCSYGAGAHGPAGRADYGVISIRTTGVSSNRHF